MSWSFACVDNRICLILTIPGLRCWLIRSRSSLLARPWPDRQLGRACPRQGRAQIRSSRTGNPGRQSGGRDAGGSRTHLDRVAAGGLAVWLQRQEKRRCPRQESNLVRDLRTVVCAPPHPEDDNTAPARESSPALRLRRPPCLRHTRGECPCQESNLGLDLRRVACRPSHSKGRSWQQGRKDSNPVRPGWSRSPLPGGHPCCMPSPDECA